MKEAGIKCHNTLVFIALSPWRKNFDVDEELPLLLRASILQEKIIENLG